jgi:hypothetical protein
MITCFCGVFDVSVCLLCTCTSTSHVQSEIDAAPDCGLFALRIASQVGNELKDANMNTVRTLAAPTPQWEKQDTDHVALLVKETVSAGHSCLVFCASRQGCEQAARHVMALLGEIPEKSSKKQPAQGTAGGQAGTSGAGGVMATPDGRTVAALAAAQVTPGSAGGPPPGSRAAIVQELRQLQGGGDPLLVECMSKGVAFHHRGACSASHRTEFESLSSHNTAACNCCRHVSAYLSVLQSCHSACS